MAMPINPFRKIIKKKIRKGSKAGSKTKFATMKKAKSFHGPTGKDRSIKYTSTPTTPVAKGRGMAKRMSKASKAPRGLQNFKSFSKVRAPMPARTGHGGATGPKPSVKPRVESSYEKEKR